MKIPGFLNTFCNFLLFIGAIAGFFWLFGMVARGLYNGLFGNL